MAKQPGQPSPRQAPRAQGQKQAQDAYAQRLKTLSSAVQRIRGWVGSDPSRAAELGDALVAVTAHRLHGHVYAEAAADAQEAVVVAGRLLTQQGPIGPYTPVPDAVRYFTAAVQLAALQAGVGLTEPAGRTLSAAAEWRDQLRRHVDITAQLDPSTVALALWVQGRAALTAGDVAGANAVADAALDRLVEGDLTGLDDSYLALDVHRLVADARWAAGDAEAAVTHDELARLQLDRVSNGRLATPGRLSPALLTRLSEPVFAANRAAADRLVGSGDGDRGLVVRRSLIDALRGLTKRGGEPTLAQLARSLDDLAGDLRLVGRADEAELAADEASQLADRLSGETAETVRAELGSSADRPERRAGTELIRDWAPLDADRAFAAATAGGVASRAAGEAELVRQAHARAEAERAEAHRLEDERQATARDELSRREAERRAAERAEAERAAYERAEAERVAAELAELERLVAEQAAAEEEAARLETKRRREERLEEHRREEERLEAERREAERVAREQALSPEEAEQRELDRLAAELAELERAEADRVEAERLEAERVGAERVEAERIEAERVEAERLEAERQAAARVEAEAAKIQQEQADRELAEQDRVDRERAAAEQAAAEQAAIEQAAAQAATEQEAAQAAEAAERERAAAEQAERDQAAADREELVAEQTGKTEPAGPAPEPDVIPTDELDEALAEWRAAKAAGERRRSRTANERVVELLRPRAEADLPAYGPALVDALEQLSSIRLRTGDIFGSRGPAREAKALARSLGR